MLLTKKCRQIRILRLSRVALLLPSICMTLVYKKERWQKGRQTENPEVINLALRKEKCILKAFNPRKSDAV